MIFNCPGSQKFKQPEPQNTICDRCGQEVEIWTDEVEATCPGCGAKATRKTGQCCLDWCKYAKECVGEEKYDTYMKKKKGGT